MTVIYSGTERLVMDFTKGSDCQIVSEALKNLNTVEDIHGALMAIAQFKGVARQTKRMWKRVAEKRIEELKEKN